MSLTAHGAIASWPTLPANLRGLGHELAECHESETGNCDPLPLWLAARMEMSAPEIMDLIEDLVRRGVIYRDEDRQIQFVYFGAGAET